MIKELNRIGYSAELKFDTNWKVSIICNNKELYFYVFDNKEEAKDMFDRMN